MHEADPEAELNVFPQPRPFVCKPTPYSSIVFSLQLSLLGPKYTSSQNYVPPPVLKACVGKTREKKLKQMKHTVLSAWCLSSP